MAGTDVQRGEYPALLATLHPNSAVAILNDRVQTIGKTNRDVADWLQERRRVEEAYVQGLRKLSRREPPDVSGDELGVFTASWQRIVGGIATLADSHQTYAKRIESDVERPLREFVSHNREMQQLSTITGNLHALAKDYDQALKKSDKVRAGNANAAKLADASENIDTAKAQWDSQAPFVFENLQAVDESRLNQLRDLLTQLQTHEVDQVEKNRATAESCLNALLSVNTADEIQAFAAKNAGAAERVPSRTERPSSAARDRHERRTSRILPSLGGSSSSQGGPPSSYRPVNGDDTADTSEIASSSNAPVTPAQDEKKPKGLRRLGTVFSRKRQSVMLRPTPGRGKSNTSQRLGSSTDLAEEPIAEAESTVSRERSREPPTTSRTDPLPSPRPPRSSSMRSPNGAVSEYAPQLAAPVQTASLTMPEPSQVSLQPTQPSAPPVMQQEPESFSAAPPTSAFDAIAQAQREAAEAGEGGFDGGARPYQVDIRNAPISEEGPTNADQAMASVASALRAQAAPPARRQGTIRGRRDVRNTVFLPSDSAPVFDSTAPQAPSSTAFAAPQAVAPITRSPTEMAPASVIPAAAAPAAAVAAAAPMSQIAAHRQYGSEDHTSDTQSVRSGRSMASSAAGPSGTATKHAESQAPGLASSIIETVSATLEQGAIVRCAVQGELALSFNPPGSGAAAARETIRLDNFPSLEKVAPNPSFIAQRTPGEYSVDLPALALATGHAAHAAPGKPAVAFKYKLHVEPGDALALARHCPVLLTPSWKHEPAQSSAILTYALNPAFAAPAGGSVTLHNVFFVLHLAGARAASCQSKPAGTFSKRENLLYWRFDELSLSAGAGPQKLIARFATDAQATGGRVEARWEAPGVAGPGVLGVSRLDAPASDPFADESAAAPGAWTEVGGARRLVSGAYVAT